MDFYKKASVAGCALALTGLAAIVNLLAPSTNSSRPQTKPVAFEHATEVLDTKTNNAVQNEPRIEPIVNSNEPREPKVNNEPSNNKPVEPQPAPQKKDDKYITIDELESRLCERIAESSKKIDRKNEIKSLLSDSDLGFGVLSNQDYAALKKEFEELGEYQSLRDLISKYSAAYRTFIGSDLSYDALYKFTAENFPHLAADVTEKMVMSKKGDIHHRFMMLIYLHDAIPAEDNKSRQAFINGVSKVIDEDKGEDSQFQFLWYSTLKQNENIRRALPPQATGKVLDWMRKRAESTREDHYRKLEEFYADARNRLQSGEERGVSPSWISVGNGGGIHYNDPKEFIDNVNQYREMIENEFTNRINKIYNWED